MRLLRPQDAAAMLGVKVLTLADWRYRGIGPAHVKVGRFVRYRLDAIEAWIADHTVAAGVA